MDIILNCSTQRVWYFESLVVLLQTEIILTKSSQGGKTIANASTFLPKMPPNPTRIDHLIVSQMKEQAKVRHGPKLPSPDQLLYSNIDTYLKRFLQFSVEQSNFVGELKKNNFNADL